MKNFIALIALTTLVAAPAFAAPKKTVKKVTTTTTTTTSDPVAATEAPHSSHSSYSGSPEYSGEFGLGTAASKFHFGVGFKAQVPVEIQNNDFKFGGRTGFYFGPSDPTSWIIPILATAEFDFRTSNELKPFIGLEMGISITHVSFMGISGSSTDFALLFVPGVNLNSQYFVEVPLGTLGSSFAILPSVGMHF